MSKGLRESRNFCGTNLRKLYHYLKLKPWIPIRLNVLMCTLQWDLFLYLCDKNKSPVKALIRQKAGCWHQVIYCVPVSESKKQWWLATYASGDQQQHSTNRAAPAHFHTLIHPCTFANSVQHVAIKCWIIPRKSFKVACDTEINLIINISGFQCFNSQFDPVILSTLKCKTTT